MSFLMSLIALFVDKNIYNLQDDYTKKVISFEENCVEKALFVNKFLVIYKKLESNAKAQGGNRRHIVGFIT
jgi:hypothetical protein